MARRCGCTGRILEVVPPSARAAPREATDGDRRSQRRVTRPVRPNRRGDLELLLQATDDLSLVVSAEEVWRAGDQLQRASRSLSAPHEVFLAELGRAVRIYPALGEALRQPTPTGLALDLGGAHSFLVHAAPALEVAGFGVLLPSWWGRPQARLGVRLKASASSTSIPGCRLGWPAQSGRHLRLRLGGRPGRTTDRPGRAAPPGQAEGTARQRPRPVDGVPPGRGRPSGPLPAGAAQDQSRPHDDHRRSAPGGGGRRSRPRCPDARHLGRRATGGIAARRAGRHARRAVDARGVRRRTTPLSAARRGLAQDVGAPRARRLPGRRHGTGQDGDRAGASAGRAPDAQRPGRRRPTWAHARHLPDLGGRQLGRGSPSVSRRSSR